MNRPPIQSSGPWSALVDRRLQRLRETTQVVTQDSAFTDRVARFIRHAERDWGGNVVRVARRWVTACALFVVVTVCWALQASPTAAPSDVEGPLPVEVWW